MAFMDLRSYPALSVIMSKTPNEGIFYRRVVVHPFVPLLESLSRFGSVAGRCVLWLSCRGRGDVDGWRGSTRRSWRGVGTKEEQYCEQLARCWSNAKGNLHCTLKSNKHETQSTVCESVSCVCLAFTQQKDCEVNITSSTLTDYTIIIHYFGFLS